MLIVDEDSVYEIDENCIRRKKVPEECRIYQKIVSEKNKRGQKKETSGNADRQGK
jgi:hypothetical protein